MLLLLLLFAVVSSQPRERSKEEEGDENKTQNALLAFRRGGVTVSGLARRLQGGQLHIDVPAR